MYKKNNIESQKNQITVISFLLGIAVIATTVAYILYKYASDKAYNIKWKDYDECGLM